MEKNESPISLGSSRSKRGLKSIKEEDPTEPKNEKPAKNEKPSKNNTKTE